MKSLEYITHKKFLPSLFLEPSYDPKWRMSLSSISQILFPSARLISIPSK